MFCCFYSSSVVEVESRFLRCSWMILLALTALLTVSGCDGLKLCKRCESSEMTALRDYYETAGFSRSGITMHDWIKILWRFSSWHHKLLLVIVAYKMEFGEFELLAWRVQILQWECWTVVLILRPIELRSILIPPMGDKKEMSPNYREGIHCYIAYL